MRQELFICSFCGEPHQKYPHPHLECTAERSKTNIPIRPFIQSEPSANLNELAAQAFVIADAHGWHDKPREFGTTLMLIVTEVAEAMEEWRLNDDAGLVEYEKTEHGPKPVGVSIELADILIRVLHLCAVYHIDIQEAFKQKMDYNAKRPYRHGNKNA